jgi:hypoxanthine-DNA glycosylase
MVEIHPFGDFIPSNTKYLILGSFTGKRSEEDILNDYDWFYGTKRNLFWPILQEVYKLELKTKENKQQLFNRLGVAITDIILSCERRSNNNSDMNLTNIVLNQEVANILKKNKIIKIFFSSRFVEKLFKRHFKDLITQYPEVELITLPSPSPRYASMTISQKIIRYKEILPRLDV